MHGLPNISQEELRQDEKQDVRMAFNLWISSSNIPKIFFLFNGSRGLDKYGFVISDQYWRHPEEYLWGQLQSGLRLKKSIIKLISGPNQLISKQNKLISKQNQLISEQNKLISELIIGTEERGKIRPNFKFYNCYRHTSAQSTCLSQVIVFSFTLLFLTLIFFSKNPFLLISIVLRYPRRQLIESLRIARDIDKTLLVFSHDVWDVAINRLVRWSKSAK